MKPASWAMFSQMDTEYSQQNSKMIRAGHTAFKGNIFFGHFIAPNE
jgi:hypothetical protein